MIRRALTFIGLTAAGFAVSVASSGSAPLRAAEPQQPMAAYRTLVDQYCVTCHNQRSKTGGLALDTVDLAKVGENSEIWEKAVKRLSGSLMPPPGNRQPPSADVKAFVKWLEGELDRAAATPDPGAVVLHRMNRTEYQNSVRELFDIDIDAVALLPADDVSDGFDNIANVLTVSPLFLDQYITAARAVSIEAVGAPRPAGVIRATLRAGEPVDYGENWAPLGTQVTSVAEHFFPGEGDYEIRANGSVVTVDGIRIPNAGRVHLTAGTHKVGLAAVPRGAAIESDAVLQPLGGGGGGGAAGGGGGRGGRGGGAGNGVQITGPYNPVGPVLEPGNRRKVFICYPPANASAGEELACAAKIFLSVARRAYRRPVTDEDAVAPIAFFKDERTRNGFEGALQVGLMPILSSPKFLYRAESTPAGVKPGAVYKLGNLELASRLSFFLWSQIPDEELLNLAIAGRLSDSAVFEGQVQRMLKDARSKSFVTNFGFQWFHVRDVDRSDPDSSLFPGFDAALRQAFRREMELFLDSVLRSDRSVTELLTADYTFVNERLATHYGIPDIRGAQFRRIKLEDTRRWGLLGKGAVLLVSSYPNRTSVVLRGSWILENILGTPPAPPPPDIEAFKENKEGQKALTVREIMEQHRSKTSCNACHGVIDPMGFALEVFDAIGEARRKDRWAQTVIDASGKLADGTPIGGPDDLRKALDHRSEQFVQTLTEKLMTYALGRTVETQDLPTVRRIVRDASKNGNRFASIVMGIVRSPAFQMQRAPKEEVAAK